MRALTLSEALIHGSGPERAFLCPEHGDSRPSASVNVIKRVWYCYTCHARGDLNGEARLAEPDYDTMKLWLEQKLEVGHVYPEAWLARWDSGPVHPYWLARFDASTARSFRLGSDPDSHAVTYPLRDPAGAPLGVVRRLLEPGERKYLYPRGVDVGRLLFNYTPWHRRRVVLVEGALDAVALWMVGVHAMAIYGNRLHPDQVGLINKIDPLEIWTCYDADDAGFVAHCETERAFRNRLVGRVRWPRAWGKDIDELTLDRRKSVVQGLVSDEIESIESGACESHPPRQSPSLPTTSRRSRLVIRPRSTSQSSSRA